MGDEAKPAPAVARNCPATGQSCIASLCRGNAPCYREELAKSDAVLGKLNKA